VVEELPVPWRTARRLHRVADMAPVSLVAPVAKTSQILKETAHRPWPIPSGPWIMTQTWNDLLFAHYPVAVDIARRLVPARFQIEHYNGTAWLGVVPFHMTDVRVRALPPIPGTSAFHELNVRTYVTVDAKPGVYFFSLDAGSALAVWGARRLGLPYYHADMSLERDGLDVLYQSRRQQVHATFAAAYRPVGGAFPPEPGSLEHFLTERYCLYAVSRGGRPYRLDIHHRPWLLQPASAEISRSSVISAAGFSPGPVSPVLHYAQQQPMVAWAPSFLD
jgi:uncharacterized protein